MAKRRLQKIGERSKDEPLKIIRTQFNPRYKRSEGEYNDMASETMPSMSLTIKELLINHSRGIDSPVKTYDGQYFGEEEIPVYKDLTDMEIHKQELQNQLENLKERIDEEIAAKELEKEKGTTPPEPPQNPPETSKNDEKQ